MDRPFPLFYAVIVYVSLLVKKKGCSSMKTIRVNFVDFWDSPHHDLSHDLCYKLLARKYHVEVTEDPDYLFCGGIGHDHYNYDCVKIVTIGENISPDFNAFDYAIGFDKIEFGDRYLRVPLFVFYDEYEKLVKGMPSPGREELLNRKFCSFVVSNAGADDFRVRFFKELSKYKCVDSGGRYLNNVGGPVKDKNEFCRQYKFNIAFENCCSPGYVTEKVMQPLTVFSVPIYYGDDAVEDDFVAQRIVRVKGASDIDRAIEEIVRLDKNDDEYVEKCMLPSLVRPATYYYEILEKFLLNIVEQPYEEAKRLCCRGFQPILRSRMKAMYRRDDQIKWPFRKLRKLLCR